MEYHYYYLVYGGLDDYFNHSPYRPGWTYYDHTIGNPLISPKGTRDGIWTGRSLVLGVENNRLKAHHLSISGKAFHKLPYKLMLTYTQNYGTYDYPYLGESQKGKPWGTVKETPLHQISAAFVGELPFATFGPLSSQSPLRHLTLTYGIFADRGQLLPDAFGVSVGVRWDWKVK